MHDFSVTVLCSGSSGNSTLFMAGGRGVLVDAGISCRELERRLSAFGAEPSQIEAVVLTHEHTDHTRGAQRFCSEHSTPLFGTRGTLALTPHEGVEATRFAPSETLEIGPFRMSPFKVRHLAAEPVAFSVAMDSVKVGFASDLGCVTSNVVKEMSDSDILLVEANYDEEMLMGGSYPEFLKRAIRSDHGHLSNDDAAALTSRACTQRTRRVVLVHLSRENNTPQAARDAVESRMGSSSGRPKIEVVEHGSGRGPFSL